MRGALRHLAVISTLILAGSAVGSVHAGPHRCQPDHFAKLMSPDVFAQDEFGTSVSVSGDVAVIGAPLDGDGGSDYGAAYIYRFDGVLWNFETKLSPRDASEGDEFGISVAISGKVIVVGAHLDDDKGRDSGSAYVFEHDGQKWRGLAKLRASDGLAYDNFGIAVAIDGDLIVVGANLGGSNNKGAAYLFQKPAGGWVTMTETAKLTASDAKTSDEFGVSVAVSRDVVVAGTEYETSGGLGTGAAYLFTKPAAGWVGMTETAKLVASDPTEQDRFGHSVSISGDVAVVGAWGDDEGGEKTGSLYIFQKPADGWVGMTESAKLGASAPTAGDHLGWSVVIRGDVVIGGAPANLFDGTGGGAAYVFRRPAGGWGAATEEIKLKAGDGEEDDEFGFDVGLSESRVVVGARRHAALGYDNSGAAYGFRSLSDCQPNDVFDICDIATGASPDADGNGLPDECEGLGIGSGMVGRLFVEKSGGDAITLSWEPSCLATDNDYEIYEGVLSDYASHAPRFCTTGRLLTQTFVPGPGGRYYLLVPRNPINEGSFGVDSAGRERPAGPSPCRPQVLDVCP